MSNVIKNGYLLVAALLFGCSEPLQLPPANHSIHVRCGSNDAIYSPSSEPYSVVMSWLSRNSLDWKPSLASYVSDVEVDVGRTNIKVLKTLIVVNQNQRQLVKQAQTASLIESLCDT